MKKKYIPDYLSLKSKKKLKKELDKSKKMYKNKKYYTRKKVKDYKHKTTRWKNKAKQIYKTDDLSIRNLSKKTKCTKKALNKIINKGKGAYYSSGSRPNQTPTSWSMARLYSAISGGPAFKYDKHILKDGCKKNSKVFNILKNQMGGNNGRKMKEVITKIIKSPIKNKKYRACIKNKKTKKLRHIDFGGKGYEQYKDRTKLKLYMKDNHGNEKRRNNYFNRHSGTPTKYKAIDKEIKKSDGLYNAKILSHICLW